MPSRNANDQGPHLSVIVPVYHDAEALTQCLEALAASVNTDFEVIVVDDGSPTPVTSLVQPYGFRCLRIDGPGGPARARNRDVALARADTLVSIDADVCVHPDTLARFAAHFATDSTLAAVMGTCDDTPAAPNFLSQYKNLFHHFVHQSYAGEASTFWSGCGAMRRDMFLAFDGFDEQRYRRPAI